MPLADDGNHGKNIYDSDNDGKQPKQTHGRIVLDLFAGTHPRQDCAG